jgi:(2Fe-2S) ferredoxin
MEKNVSPYLCHIFVCTHDRKGERKSCADGNSNDIRMALKQEVDIRRWKGTVRVSQCGCLGLCQKGPNVILYPQKIWFSEVLESDVPAIISEIESIVKGSSPGMHVGTK